MCFRIPVFKEFLPQEIIDSVEYRINAEQPSKELRRAIEEANSAEQQVLLQDLLVNISPTEETEKMKRVREVAELCLQINSNAHISFMAYFLMSSPKVESIMRCAVEKNYTDHLAKKPSYLTRKQIKLEKQMLGHLKGRLMLFDPIGG